MDEEKFLIALKSTIDKVMNDLRDSLLADYPTLKAVEVDDISQTDEDQKSSDPVLLWSLGSVEPAPANPMYSVEIMAGAKTTVDGSNYILTRLMTSVRAAFPVRDSMLLHDYSGEVADPEVAGSLYVSGSAMAQQEFDKQSGIRYAVIRGRAVAYG